MEFQKAGYIMSTNIEQLPKAAVQRIQELIAALDESDGLKREPMRLELERMGKVVTPFLIASLENGKERIKWEVIKAMIAIRDDRAAPVLVSTLMDSSFEIRWLAAEALIAIGRDALVPLLRALTEHYESAYLREGAHHILTSLNRQRLLDEQTAKVIYELEDWEPLEPFPIVAAEALESLTGEVVPNPTAVQTEKSK
jgi:HEAT repeat protein